MCRSRRERAIRHYFSPGNLTALRELALRRTAQRVDAQMLSYMQSHAIRGPWAAGERVLVCIDEGPGSAALVRHAGRLAEQLARPLDRAACGGGARRAAQRGGAGPHRRGAAPGRAPGRRRAHHPRPGYRRYGGRIMRASNNVTHVDHRARPPRRLARLAARAGGTPAAAPCRRYYHPPAAAAGGDAARTGAGRARRCDDRSGRACRQRGDRARRPARCAGDAPGAAGVRRLAGVPHRGAGQRHRLRAVAVAAGLPAERARL